MAIDGTYEVELTTTLGPQSITLTLETDGDSLSGIMDGHFGRQSFSGGTVSGEDVSWSVLLESPMGQMNLAVEAKVTGDQISGQVKLGAFQPSIFNGTRV